MITRLHFLRHPFSSKTTLLVVIFAWLHLSLTHASFEEGLTLYEQGNFEEAIESFETELAFKETGAVRHNLGVTYLQIDKLGEAIWNMERALLLNPKNEAYSFKLDAMREAAGLPPVEHDWKERITSLLHHDHWMRVFTYFVLTTLAAYFIPIAAGWKHNQRIKVLMTICAIGSVASGLAFAHVRHLLDQGTSLVSTPTELRAAPARAAPQTGLIRTGERALVSEQHKEFVYLITEGGAEGWIHNNDFRKFY